VEIHTTPEICHKREVGILAPRSETGNRKNCSLFPILFLRECFKFASIKVKNQQKRGKINTGTHLGLKFLPLPAQADSRI